MSPDTFPRLLAQHAQQRPNSPAIREKSRGIWQTLSWAEFAQEVAQIAGALKASGFQPQ